MRVACGVLGSIMLNFELYRFVSFVFRHATNKSQISNSVFPVQSPVTNIVWLSSCGEGKACCSSLE